MTTACGPPASVCILETHTCLDSCSTYLSFFPVDLDAWGSLLSLSEMSVPYQGRKNQSGTGAEQDATDEHSEFQAQLDQFLKLGFSSAQVRAVLMKLGHHEDTNRVLEELIQAGMEREEKAEPPVSTPILVCGEGTDKAPACYPSTLPSPMDLEQVADGNDALRSIVIDGSNVAMSHGNKEVFSCRGIQLAVKYFLDRGHDNITVFVPSWRREQPRPDVPITDQHILRELEKRKILVFTPSRRVAGKRVVCYDDRFIVKLAFELDGVIVSNDTYRDLQVEKPEWKRFIEERLLMFSFVSDRFMPPDDPLGRHGPTLDNFLRKTPRVPKRQPCPYGKKCTYGIKCKFSHPERAKQSHRTLADELREKAKVSASSHRAPPSDPAPVQHTSLEDVMEQKLVLNRSGPIVKTHTNKNVLVLKTRPQSSQRKFGPTCEQRCNSAHISNHELLDSAHASTHGLLDSAHASNNGLLDSTHTSTHGHLDYVHASTHGLQDSGLGSYECYCTEFHGGCGEHACEGELWKPQTAGRHLHPLSGSQTCTSCCAVSSNTGYQHHSMGLGASQNLAAAPYCQHQYHSYGGTHNYSPVSRPQYSLPTNYPRSAMPLPHGYWSEPHGRFSYSPPRPIQGESAPWGMATSKAGSLIPEREQVRKKLMAVFNARLVDRTMEMFPNLMDPQKLAVKILNLQSYEGVL